ncbi:MAG TPA: nitroreductase family deazaflavin-dependent oxidoreductase [Chloroflexota bacterium]|nr:nitroreductase family deazaflavin-dependent oxidoreductase [Chloroflexota bacterium]
MADTEQPLESATEWVREHVQRYVETKGEEGHVWRGVPTLLLTTRGRKSGQLRRQALIYGQDGEGTYVIVGSKGGSETHPLWYLNLRADPTVHLQVGAEVFDATARTAEGEERERLWQMMAGIFPMYNEYRQKTKREIPVVVLRRV